MSNNNNINNSQNQNEARQSKFKAQLIVCNEFTNRYFHAENNLLCLK